MPLFDIMLDEDNDLAVSADGDWVVDESDELDMQLLLNSSVGNWKQSPTCGFGLPGYLEDDIDRKGLDVMKKGMQLELQADGFNNVDIKILLTGNQILSISTNGTRG